VLGVVDAGAGFEAPPGSVLLEEEPQAVRPAATARPSAAPKISLRGVDRLVRMYILPWRQKRHAQCTHTYGPGSEMVSRPDQAPRQPVHPATGAASSAADGEGELLIADRYRPRLAI
jgi:hypothetical protein